MINEGAPERRWETIRDGAGSGAPILGIDAQSLMAIALRWKGPIIAAGVFAAVVTYLALLQVSPTYSARTQVILGAGASPAINIPNVVPDANTNVAFTESAVIVMQSTDVLRAVVEELKLDEREEFNSALRTPGLLGRAAGLLKATLRAIVPNGQSAIDTELDLPGQSDGLSGTIRGLRNAVSVRVLGESQVIEIGAISTSPRLAATIADTLAQKYIERRLETKYLAGDQATEWLEGRANELRNVLRESEQEVADFRRRQIIGGQEMAADLEPHLAELTESLARLTNARAELMARRDEIKRLFAADNFVALVKILDVPTISELHDQYSNLYARIVKVESEFGDHASVARLRQSRDQVEQRLRAEIEGFISGQDVRIDILADREAALYSQRQAARREFADREQADLQLLELEREVQASREVYNRFLLRLKEARERSQFQSADAWVVSAAEVPVFPSAPQKGKLSVIFAIGGSGLALLLIALFADNRPKVADPGKVARLTGVSFVRQIPYLDSSDTPFGLLESVCEAPASAEAEAMRWLRLAVASRDRRQVNIIMVTSVDHGEGKTSLSLSLAETFAREGFNTVLVSADPRNGGVAELLAQRDLSAIGFDFVDCTEHGLQDFDGQCGPGGRLAELLGTLKRRKVIIIDTPPAMTSADVFDIGLLANHTIVACAWDQTPNETLEQCIAGLRDAGVDVKAIAINKVPAKRMQRFEPMSKPAVPPRAAPPRALPPPQPVA